MTLERLGEMFERAPENIHSCWWGSEQRVLHAQTRERGPPSALAEIFKHLSPILTSVQNFITLQKPLLGERYMNASAKAPIHSFIYFLHPIQQYRLCTLLEWMVYTSVHPNDTSGNFSAYMSAKSASNISSKPLVVIHRFSKLWVNFVRPNVLEK